MASTFSDLKIELISPGDQVGTWGTTTNTNLGTAVEEAITGSADVTFASADITLTLTDTNVAQAARNLRLNLVGTSGGARQLILGSGCQINKLYLVRNGLADAVTIRNTTGTGVAVPAGRSQFVFNDGTNVVVATSALVNLAADVTGTLPVANGGTGRNTLTVGALVLGNGTSNVNLLSGSSIGQIPEWNGTAWVAATPAAGGVANVTASAPLASSGGATPNISFTGTLPVTNGGTGRNNLTSNNVLLGSGTSAVSFVAPGTNGNVLTSNGTTWVSQASSGGAIIGFTTNANAAIGSGALTSRTSGVQNAAFGFNALGSITNGFANVAVGSNCGSAITEQQDNVAIGSFAYNPSGFAAGDGNVAIGAEAGFFKEGNNCIYIGFKCANQTAGPQTGDNQIVIGAQATPSTNTVSNQITLGNSSITQLRCQVTTITSLSDERDKKNIKDLPVGLDLINALRPVEFDWNMRDGGKVDIHDMGFVAQQLLNAQEQVGVTIPGLVSKDNPDKLEAGYGTLIPILVKAMQELSAEVARLKKHIEGE